MASYGELDAPKVIVAIDFGTTFSGFSYIHVQSGTIDHENLLDNVQKNASRDAEYELKGWGWEALVEYKILLEKSGNADNLDGKRFHYITKFKLALAGSKHHDDSPGESYRLPEGFEVERVIADYLHQLSIEAEKDLQKTNPGLLQISRKDIQWCLTIPAIWNDSAKQQMEICAQKANLISGPSNTSGAGSPHPLVTVLEPEAASAYCMLKYTNQAGLIAGSKILVVDLGGGTVDLVFHEKVSSTVGCHRVKETCNGGSGALCGGTYVDEAFEELLSTKINCYKTFISEYPSAIFKIQSTWENIKLAFDGELGPYEFTIPTQLSDYWKNYNQEKGLHTPNSKYGDLIFTLQEMKNVFDRAVNPILKLIADQLAVGGSEDVHALLLVGGFSGCEYVSNTVRKQFGKFGKFGSKVKRIIKPTHPGKATVTGAIAHGIASNAIVTSRKLRKTYGVAVFNGRNKSGELNDCKFCVLAREGDEVAVDQCIKQKFCRAEWEELISVKRDPSMFFEVFSTKDSDPKLVTDKGTNLECTHMFTIPCLDEKPWVEVSVFLGKSIIKLTAKGVNFKSEIEVLPLITLDAEPLKQAAYSRRKVVPMLGLS
ncbi:unnamed protein product [Calypogeia fissa]